MQDSGQALAALRRGEISPIELVAACTARIDAVDDMSHSLSIRCFGRALEQPRALSRAAGSAALPSFLDLPIAVKNHNDVGRVLTTDGSPIFADNVARSSDAAVARLERHGAIALTQSYVPEWANGHRFNLVGGTRSPRDTRFGAVTRTWCGEALTMAVLVNPLHCACVSGH